MDYDTLVMIQSEPLLEQEIEEGLEFVQALDPVLGVKVAYWLKEPERRYWRLHVLTEKARDVAKYEYYPQMSQVHSKGDYGALEDGRITLDLANDPIAQAMLDYKIHRVGTRNKRLRNQPMGKAYIEGALIYAYPPNSIQQPTDT
jgi:hypothetical protein